MAKNFLAPGIVVEIISPAAGTTAGVGVLTGQMFGIALDTTTVGQTCRVALEGTFEVAKVSALVIAVGAAVYWVPGTSNVNVTSAGQKEVGICLGKSDFSGVDAPNPSATCLVRLVPTVRTSVAA
jgi:predicted RecA/RadA family phage recombinase